MIENIVAFIACICSFAIGWAGGWAATTTRRDLECMKCIERIRNERKTEPAGGKQTDHRT